jgi:antitoxin PrlF
MASIQEVATLTSKGQITLPKSVRQVLGVDTGSKLTFEVRDGEVVVRRAGGAEHEDPAIAAFLGLIEADIRAGRRVQSVPKDLARAMVTNARRPVDLTEEIEGDVEL